MSGAHKGVDKSDACASFASTSRHDKKKTAAAPFDAFHYRPNGLNLVITASDSCVNQLICERFLVLPNIEQAFKILP
jgi:hypothetical protein